MTREWKQMFLLLTQGWGVGTTCFFKSFFKSLIVRQHKIWRSKDIQLSTSHENVRRQKFTRPNYGGVLPKGLRHDTTQWTSILEIQQKSRKKFKVCLCSLFSHHDMLLIFFQLMQSFRFPYSLSFSQQPPTSCSCK